ncbi:hypothetical protein PU629_00745 [Pullulanibacillus sp. KACC 23026]|uniref:COG4705 family protein n=1 Tax=Pullulanibacillus sp. KACC 23026 TaxID=3028315 RepID=UPI0023B11FD4|nr:hypothetical protein [Pullulanibacillus sp. KACC 23026]WEG12915.1 hypothetical protein PU629_00745 [Pullulanibacillus sp. KACC 23026]
MAIKIDGREALTDNGQIVLTKVPEITINFWIAKLLTTGMGEVFSDFLVKQINPIMAVGLGGLGLILSLWLQFTVKRYMTWIYWLVVVMVSIFGTMAADTVHVVLGIPYYISTIGFMLGLFIIFYLWYRIEHSLSIHSIYTKRRELFYWLTVLTTFALGTACGDMTASTLHLGYLSSGILFLVLFMIPALGVRFANFSPVFSFWFAYIMTRPVGASFSDWLSKPKNGGGMGFGDGQISLRLTIIIILVVGYLHFTKKDLRLSNLKSE